MNVLGHKVVDENGESHHMENQSKICLWCHTQNGDELPKYKADFSIIDDDFGQYVHPNLIHYCPFCGRKFEESE